MSWAGLQDVDAVQPDLAFGPLVPVEFIDAVVNPEMGGFAAAGGADDGGDLVFGDIQVVVEQGLGLAVVKIQVPDGKLGGYPQIFQDDFGGKDFRRPVRFRGVLSHRMVFSGSVCQVNHGHYSIEPQERLAYFGLFSRSS